MNRRFLCFCVWLIAAAPLFGQEAKIPPLPPGPLLKRAPDYSAWTLTVEGQAAGERDSVKKTDPASHGPKDQDSVTLVKTVIKTAPVILEQNVATNGQRHQIWHVSGIRIVAGAFHPMVSPDYGVGDIFSTNFGSSDFAGLDWISPGTYSGVAKYQGNDCLVFKGSVSPLGEKAQSDERAFIAGERAMGGSAPNALRVAATAYIDLATRLPVFAQFGQEKRFYRYGAPPAAPLVLPPELAGTLKAYTKQIERLSAPAARAY